LRKVRELSKHQRKPNRDVLLEICDREGVKPACGVYIGDSIARDMYMAKNAGLLAIWAKYGTIHQQGLYEALVRISHWTDEDIEREVVLKRVSRNIKPDITLEVGISELLERDRIVSAS
jgi:histidinol phosphatase-like enzyme